MRDEIGLRPQVNKIAKKIVLHPKGINPKQKLFKPVILTLF
jgi:hypothetical protein